MGNLIPSRCGTFAGKVLLPDGTIYEFDCRMTVAELMLEHPQQFVVELNSVMTKNKLTPLPADQTLEKEKAYAMLQLKQGKATDDETRRILTRATSVLRSDWIPRSLKNLPLLLSFCSSTGVTMQREKNGVIEKDRRMEKAEDSGEPRFLPEDVDKQLPEYLSRQFSGKVWKPTLDTIKESSTVEKIPHWLF